MNSLFAKLEGHVAATTGLIAVGIWAFLEANFWFIAPDFLLIIFGFVLPSRWLKLATAALAGSLIGGVAYYLLLRISMTTFEPILLATPFVTPRMLEFIDNAYTNYGYAGILVQSVSFMSFKIWTYQAVKFEFAPYLYFPLVMISRAFRLMLVTWVAAIIGRKCNQLAKPYFPILLVVYSIAFVSMLIVVES